MTRGSFLKNIATLFGAAALAPVAKELSGWSLTANPENLEVARYISGFCIVSRHSLRNIQFLQSWLPSHLLKTLDDK